MSTYMLKCATVTTLDTVLCMPPCCSPCSRMHWSQRSHKLSEFLPRKTESLQNVPGYPQHRSGWSWKPYKMILENQHFQQKFLLLGAPPLVQIADQFVDCLPQSRIIISEPETSENCQEIVNLPSNIMSVSVKMLSYPTCWTSLSLFSINMSRAWDIREHSGWCWSMLGQTWR